jgi:hypothetical protein
VTDFAPDAVLSFFEQTQRAKERRSRLWGVPAPRRVNKPMPEPEVRSEPVVEILDAAPAPFANDNDEPRAPPTVAFILAHVARYYGISRNDLEAQRRDRSAAWPRHIAVYLAKELTPNSWSEIGRRIGDRDHSTILSSYSRIREALSAAPKEIASDIQEITKRIDARLSPFETPRFAGKPFWASHRLGERRQLIYPRARDVDWDFWTAERVAELGTLWQAGLSQEEVAAAMGTTKGAISGKISRLGIARRQRGASH